MPFAIQVIGKQQSPRLSWLSGKQWITRPGPWHFSNTSTGISLSSISVHDGTLKKFSLPLVPKISSNIIAVKYIPWNQRLWHKFWMLSTNAFTCFEIKTTLKQKVLECRLASCLKQVFVVKRDFSFKWVHMYEHLSYRMEINDRDLLKDSKCRARSNFCRTSLAMVMRYFRARLKTTNTYQTEYIIFVTEHERKVENEMNYGGIFLPSFCQIIMLTCQILHLTCHIYLLEKWITKNVLFHFMPYR